MRLNIDIEKHFNLKKIKLDLKDVINDFAGNIIKDHKQRLQHGQGVDMKLMQKLNPLTIKSKRQKKYKNPRIPLNATGLMSKIKFKDSKKATKSRQFAILKPPDKRDEIGAYHQSDNPRPPKREWFGITVKQEKKGLKMMEQYIEDELKRA